MKKTFKILGIIAGAILSFVCVIFAVVYLTTGESREVFEDFANKMTQPDEPSAVYELMHPDLQEVVKGTPTEQALGAMCEFSDMSYLGASSSTGRGELTGYPYVQ